MLCGWPEEGLNRILKQNQKSCFTELALGSSACHVFSSALFLSFQPCCSAKWSWNIILLSIRNKDYFVVVLMVGVLKCVV